MKIKEAKIDTMEEVRASFRLTRRCNNNCPHCYLNLPLTAKVEEFSPREWEKIIDQLVLNNINYLSFTGGEPTLYSGFKEVYMYAKKKGMTIQLMTNATYFDEAIKALLYKYPPQEVSVTVYGTNEANYAKVTGNKGGWSGFLKNMDFLVKLQKEKGTNFVLTSIITKDTMNFIKEIDAFCSKYTGKNPDYIKALYGRIDGDFERNEMIKAKRLSQQELKLTLTNLGEERNPCFRIVPEAEKKAQKELFICSIRRKKNIYFFEDGTVSHCIIMPAGEYVIKLTKEELDNFDYKKIKEKLSEITAPLLALKVNEHCATCELRTLCLSCPIKNLSLGLDIFDYDAETCLQELCRKTQ